MQHNCGAIRWRFIHVHESRLVKVFCLSHSPRYQGKSVRCLFFYTAITLLLPAHLHAENVSCPADHHERGKKPPAGTEWQCIDKNGQPDGPWLTWYGNGQLMSERQMKNGKEHGRQRSWWPNGQLMMEGISYEGNRYKGFKYWSVSGEPTQLNIETETVTKKVDETQKSSQVKPVTPANKTSVPATK